MKRYINILLLLCLVLTAHALDKRQTKINSIKKSKSYLYSDVTMKSHDEAVSQAFAQLQQEILSWATDRASRKNGNKVSPKDINKLIDTVMVRRADMYRVFAYVSKVRLVPLFSDWNLVLTDDLDVDDVTEPDNKSEEEIVQEVPELSQPETPHEDANSESKQDGQAKDVIANDEIRKLLKNNFLSRKGGVIEQLKKARNFFELKPIMEPLKRKGDIIDYGKYATAMKPEECYLIVYDPAGNIKALLGKGKDTRPNLKTGKDDTIKNYRGCGAIWFTLNED